MDTMEAPEPGTPGKEGEDEPSHNKLEDMIKELGTALTGINGTHGKVGKRFFLLRFHVNSLTLGQKIFEQ